MDTIISFFNFKKVFFLIIIEEGNFGPSAPYFSTDGTCAPFPKIMICILE